MRGWGFHRGIHGAFRDYVELPPGVYTVGGEECATEPLSYPRHFSAPSMAARWGDVVELWIYAGEKPEVPGGFVEAGRRGALLCLPCSGEGHLLCRKVLRQGEEVQGSAPRRRPLPPGPL